MDPAKAETIPALYRGDLVCIHDDYARPADRGIVYEIVKENPRNWKITPINGDGRAVNCPPHGLRKATEAEISAATATAAATDRRPPLHLYQIVTVTGPRWREPANKLWLVIKVHPGGGANLTELGSDGRRYYRDIPRTTITPLPADRIAAMYAAGTTAPSDPS